MALVQDTTIPGPPILSGSNTLKASLFINEQEVRLGLVAANRTLAWQTAAPGSGPATTLLSYFDQSTGLLNGTGETAVLSWNLNGHGLNSSDTVDDYFS